MKLIDLLNKKANGEELPEEFKYKGRYFSYRDNDYWCNEIDGWFSVEVLGMDNLNDVIEVSEKEQKVKKLEMETGDINDKTFLAFYITHNRYKINELIDEVNKLKRNNNDSNV